MKRLAWITSTTLALAAAWLWLNRGQQRGRRSRPAGEPPVEALAEQLQHAWADHHISA